MTFLRAPYKLTAFTLLLVVSLITGPAMGMSFSHATTMANATVAMKNGGMSMTDASMSMMHGDMTKHDSSIHGSELHGENPANAASPAPHTGHHSGQNSASMVHATPDTPNPDCQHCGSGAEAADNCTSSDMFSDCSSCDSRHCQSSVIIVLNSEPSTLYPDSVRPVLTTLQPVSRAENPLRPPIH